MKLYHLDIVWHLVPQHPNPTMRELSPRSVVFEGFVADVGQLFVKGRLVSRVASFSRLLIGCTHTHTNTRR